MIEGFQESNKNGIDERRKIPGASRWIGVVPGPQLHMGAGEGQSQMTEILLGCLPNWIRRLRRRFDGKVMIYLCRALFSHW